MAPEMFRKSALARLASPEQLDQLMEVTDTKAWWTLAALGALVIAALAWSVIGRIMIVHFQTFLVSSLVTD